jgi:hypothetical protein
MSNTLCTWVTGREVYVVAPTNPFVGHRQTMEIYETKGDADRVARSDRGTQVLPVQVRKSSHDDFPKHPIENEERPSNRDVLARAALHLKGLRESMPGGRLPESDERITLVRELSDALIAAESKLARLNELAAEHWDWKSGRRLADKLRDILGPDSVPYEEPAPEENFWDDRTTPLAYSRGDAERDAASRVRIADLALAHMAFHEVRPVTSDDRNGAWYEHAMRTARAVLNEFDVTPKEEPRG